MHAPSRKQFIFTLVILLMAIAPLSMVFSNPTSDGKIPPPPPKKASTAAQAPVSPNAKQAPTAPTSEKVILKNAKAAPGDPPPPPLSVTITLEGQQTVLVNGRKTSLTDFSEILEKEAAQKGGSPLIIIDGDGDVPMGLLHKVQGHLKDLDLTQISYRGEFLAAQKLVLPSDSIEEKLEQMPQDMIIHVTVDNKGIVTINNREVAGARIPEVVGKLVQDNPQRVVLFHTNKDTRYGAFVQVLGYLKDAGAARIAITDVSE